VTTSSPGTDAVKAPKTLVLDVAAKKATITYVRNGATVVEAYRVTPG
jgi:hypothetical protein